MSFRTICTLLVLSIASFVGSAACGDEPTALAGLEQQLAQEDPAALARDARELGDAQRGAVVFHQPHLTCVKCHTAGENELPLGPDLSKPESTATDVHLVESVVQPSKVIRKGFESVVIITDDGRTMTGLLVEDREDAVVIRDVAQDGRQVTVAKSKIDEITRSDKSIMPNGLVNTLASRQQFLDLARYLMEIAEGGPERARELRPAASLLVARPLPEYESRIDHAGMIAGLDQQAFKRGEAIYNLLCVNCHGTHDQPGSLPTSLRFASGKFKNGHDPYTMYQTLTRGFGMMVAQTWMVPQQKYDVIHYIRQAYLKSHNPSQYFAVDQAYLAGLPKGDTRGPEPSTIMPWEQMDYGPNLVATYEIGSDASNFAYKGNAIRLDHGPGGVSQGRYWMVFDYDTLRVAAAWSGKGFIDWNGINFNGRHAIHPRIVGEVHAANPTGPGWADPENGSFDDNQRIVGRDGRRYGPLPRQWAHYKGMYYHGADTIISYTVGETDVLEMPGLIHVNVDEAGSERQAGSLSLRNSVPVFTRVFNIGPRDREMVLQVARVDGARLRGDQLSDGSSAASNNAVVFGHGDAEEKKPASVAGVKFNGATRIEIDEPDAFEMRDRDFTIYARIKTRSGGTILAKTDPRPEWVPDGKTLFIRGGRLCYDIGWVGVVQSRREVNDGKWHDVAMTYSAEGGQVRLFIDGKLDGQGKLKPKKAVDGDVLRIGYTASDFPREQSFFDGDIQEVRFYQRQLEADAIAALSNRDEVEDDRLVGRWKFADIQSEVIPNLARDEHDGRVLVGEATGHSTEIRTLAAGVVGEIDGTKWSAEEGNLRLHIASGDEPLKFTLWMAGVENTSQAEKLISSLTIDRPALDLTPLTKGGPSRWREVLKTTAVLGNDDGPFAVDVLTYPENNPWFCRMRLTGFDFFDDGDRAAVCDWDGNVWLVGGLSNVDRSLRERNVGSRSEPATLTWRRIASGLFQPLGVKIVDGQIYVTCRDQICILHDLNGDGETDFYENFNNDHQVTDHFHEFAMGLQRDADGNFYYAKSARHALTALVPHHGTLLRVSKDGSRTDILATGFRAANGVCINPDGTFIVTDQEGHWNPKNRINWVREGGFYGNMFGYHDVTDSSDEAMQQPLCWITNSFDRSPAELLWVESDAWGPLAGSLVNLSYGYGKIFVVPHEEVRGQMQGGMCELPIPQLPTGIMRGRFHPQDGQLYTCGMFAWAGNQTQAGGFYRVRYTGESVHLPIGLNATKNGVRIKFSGLIDPQSAADLANYKVKTWSLKRTANYGSNHYDEKSLPVAAASVADDQATVFLELPEIQPTWCMEIKYSINSSDGKRIDGVIHNTIHHLSN